MEGSRVRSLHCPLSVLSVPFHVWLPTPKAAQVVTNKTCVLPPHSPETHCAPWASIAAFASPPSRSSLPSEAMASVVAASAVVAPAAFAAASSSVGSSEASTVKAFSGLKAATVFSSKTQKLSSVQNGSRVNCMQVGTPHSTTPLFHDSQFVVSNSLDSVTSGAVHLCMRVSAGHNRPLFQPV